MSAIYLTPTLEAGGVRPGLDNSSFVDKNAPITGKVVLLPPNLDWPALAQLESARFAQALGDNLIAIHHIGSTSIPGIWAKPVIDLLPEVRCLQRLDEARPQIEALGYLYWGEYGLPGRRFCPRLELGIRFANVHCYQAGQVDLYRHLAFRDYLRAHPEVAKDYERLKMDCRDRHPNDLVAYTDAKSDWIRATERTALEWRGQFRRCNR